MTDSYHARSTSLSRSKPPSRPSTPLRPSSRTSLRDSQTFTPRTLNNSTSAFPLEAFELAFAELSDSMADLEANFMHIQLMHESLSRFNESFAGFLYGLNMNAFCVDFPEAPIPESFARAPNSSSNTDHPTVNAAKTPSKLDLGDETFLTTDTSFVDNPPSTKTASKFATPAPAQRPASGLNKTGGMGANRAGRGDTAGPGRGIARGTAGRGSGIARGKPRGAR